MERSTAGAQTPRDSSATGRKLTGVLRFG